MSLITRNIKQLFEYIQAPLLNLKLRRNLKVQNSITNGSVNLARERHSKKFVTLSEPSIIFYLNISLFISSNSVN
jgi:hypothetical protein